MISIVQKIPTQNYRFAYSIGDVVYHRLASELCGNLIWIIWSDRQETKHYDCELSGEFVPDYAAESA